MCSVPEYEFLDCLSFNRRELSIEKKDANVVCSFEPFVCAILHIFFFSFHPEEIPLFESISGFIMSISYVEHRNSYVFVSLRFT